MWALVSYIVSTSAVPVEGSDRWECVHSFGRIKAYGLWSIGVGRVKAFDYQ